MARRATLTLATALLVAAPGAAFGQTGEEIATKAFAQEFMGMSTGVSQVQMVITNKRGESRERRILSRSAKKDGLRRTLVRFLAPADVQGTSFLLLERKGESDDQYLYLPALGRPRRIAGSQKKSSFAGSDFSYSDMETRDVADSTWKRLADEKIGPADCFHLESVPKDLEDEEYGRTELWIHKDTHIPLRLKMYDKKTGKHRKTLFVEEFKKIDGRFIVTKAKMQDEKKGSNTRIVIENIDLDADVPDADFTVEALSKG